MEEELDQFYLVEDIAEFCDYYHVFYKQKQATIYIQNHIKFGLVDSNRDIKVLTLHSLIDLEKFIHEIPWDFIKNNYNLSQRFITEFEEYLEN